MCDAIKTHRFIPAGAGNTDLPLQHEKETAVYPRWRGEHVSTSMKSIRQNGLSPLARGTRQASLAALDRTRFIPAGAGNTARSMSSWLETSVYPRWRGEHVARSATSSYQNGLSPLARGTRCRHIHIQCSHRFIPAGAGNTTAAVISRLLKPVYPRWRGEHATVSVKGRHGERFIPAGAGNTALVSCSESGSTVYPRWRGEHIRKHTAAGKNFGLSPLARGTL